LKKSKTRNLGSLQSILINNYKKIVRIMMRIFDLLIGSFVARYGVFRSFGIVYAVAGNLETCKYQNSNICAELFILIFGSQWVSPIEKDP
jgi:hypothetical protein